jgi:O-antigen ligase
MRHRFVRTVLLVLLFAAGVFGHYLLPFQLGPVTIYLYRLVVIFLVGLFLYARGRAGFMGTFQIGLPRRVLVVMAMWVTWGLFSILWSPDPLNGCREVIELCFGTMVLGCMSLLIGKQERGLGALRAGWATAVLCAGLVAVWELWTGQHLKSGFIDAASPWVLKGMATVSTFGNPNNFGSFLLMALPFIAWGVEEARSWALRIFGLAFLLGMACLIIITGSRLCLAGSLVLGIIWAVCTFKGRARPLALLGLVLIVVCMIIGLVMFKPMIGVKLLSAQSEMGGQATGTSGNTRIHLYLDSIYLTLTSFGFGIGAGGFNQRLTYGYLPWATDGITSPHNFFLEILSQYGVLVFAGFAWWMIGCWRSFKAKWRTETRHGAGFWGICCMVAYGFAALANSGFLNQQSNWLFLGSLFVMSRKDSHG